VLLSQRFKPLVRALTYWVQTQACARVRVCVCVFVKWGSRSVSLPHSHCGSSNRNGRGHRVMQSSLVTAVVTTRSCVLQLSNPFLSTHSISKC
jgi:hypothetical protein